MSLILLLPRSLQALMDSAERSVATVPSTSCDALSTGKRRRMQSERATVDLEKEIVELRALVEWLKGENSRLKARNHVLEDRSRELRRSSEEKDELIFKLTENETSLKGMNERLKERFEEQRKDSDRREKERMEEVKKIEDKCWQLRVEKRKLEIELEAAMGAIAAGGEASEVMKKAAKAEIDSLKSLVAERDGTATKLMRESEGLEIYKKEKSREIDRLLNEKMVLTERLQEENQKVSVLVERAGALKKEVEHVKDECSKFKREKSTEIVRIVDEKIALEAQLKRKDEQVKEKTSELIQQIDILEREKREAEAKCCGFKRALEAKKRKMRDFEEEKNLEAHRMVVLEKENKALEAEISKGKREGIKRILVLKMALEASKRNVEEQKEKDSSKLVHRIGVMEREKQGLEAEVKEKDEVIRVIREENDRLEAIKTKLEREIKDSASSQQVHLTSNVEMLVATVPNDGQNSAVLAHPDEQTGSQTFSLTRNTVDKLEAENARSNACKRDHPVRNSDGDNLDEDTVIAKSKKSIREIHKPTGLSVDQDLLDAFHSDRELCLKAICALYRRHVFLARPNTMSPSYEEKVFKPECASKAIALAEYLTDADPEGGMKKSVADLDRLDPKAVEECVKIAKQHYKQVFEIYRKGHLMLLA